VSERVCVCVCLRSGKVIAYNDILSHFKGIGTKLLLFTYYVTNGILAYHEREFERAIESFQLASKEEMSAVGMVTTAQVGFSLNDISSIIPYYSCYD
jgi:hypothetical protein